MVSSQKAYGLRNDFFKNPAKYGFPDRLADRPIPGGLKIYGLLNLKRTEKYVSADYPIKAGRETISSYKIFIPNAYGSGEMGEIIPAPIIAAPNEICTETYLRIGGFATRLEAENALSYLKTKFFRLLVGIKKTTQHSSTDTYSLVPMQDFSENWSDAKLYAKYQLDAEEIAFIEAMIKPMEGK